MNAKPNRRILLIDDMPAIHEDFRKLFDTSDAHAALDADEALLFGAVAPVRQTAFVLDSAFQGRDGLALVRAARAGGRPYAMAFVDMRMPPGWDGAETIARLWEADPELQVVICTAYTERSWEDMLAQLDARDRLLVLKKPFDTIEVLQLARTLVTKWDLQREAQAALRIRERAIEAALNPIVITDCGLPDHPIQYVNPAFERVTGYAAAEVTGRNPRFLNGGLDDQPELRMIAAAIHEGREAHGVVRNFRKDGREFWNEMHIAPVRDEDGATTHFVGVLNDVTEARDRARAMEYQARHDALTGLPNRVLLHDRLEQSLAHARRSGSGLAVLWLDLDHFKLVNDSFGHRVGDALLSAMAARLQTTVRESDTVARLGGDEFVVLLPGVHSASDAAAAANKVLAALLAPFQVGEHLLRAGTSLGISLFPGDGETSEELLLHADTAMYRAKSEGRNGYHFYRPELSQAARQRESLSRDLHAALEEGQFELHFQPMLDMASGRLDRAEALIRWRHPVRGLVPPGDFIPLAEESGLIVPIGKWVLDTACAQGRRWQQADPPVDLRISVNVSARQFRHNDLVDTVSAALAASGLDPGRLVLEVTESLLMQQSGSVLDTLKGLKALGVTLALDDFGTGFSSLSYLRRFPLDVLKIDRAFISGLPSTEADVAITRAIVGMAHSLGLAVVAEGVETPQQLAFLRSLKCDAAQGFLMARPAPADEVTALWHASRRALPGPGLGVAGGARDGAAAAT
ncbi:MAG: EAL domain-containing protein [Pseudomonadota bacterium]|nr:EAL domain-containing protein [Pseudomonadota bacterium]